MQILLSDSHCHLDRLHGDLDFHMTQARDAGVDQILCVSINMENVHEVISIAARYPSVYATVGIHPNEREGREATVEELSALAQQPGVVAIGETGLDFFHGKGEVTRQKERFRRHITVARECGKPLVVHTRDSAEETLQMLREGGAQSVGGVMHCFTATWETAVQAMELGFYISFSGIITFKSADALREVAAKVPNDRLLIETDAPYLAPVPHRGEPNRPAWVRRVAECLADLRGDSLEAIASVTTENFHRLFRTGAIGA